MPSDLYIVRDLGACEGGDHIVQADSVPEAAEAVLRRLGPDHFSTTPGTRPRRVRVAVYRTEKVAEFTLGVKG